MRHLQVVSLVLVVLALVISGGCGNKNPQNLQAVSGKVSLDGAPLDHGTIEFSPRQQKGGVRSGATIAAGSYSMPWEKGLPPGDYLVRIYAAEETGINPMQMPGPTMGQQQVVERIPAKYNAQSELAAKVAEGAANEFNFELKTK